MLHKLEFYFGSWSSFQLSVESNSRLLSSRFTNDCDWLEKLAPLFQPMSSKTKTNGDMAARVFPRLAPNTCICFDFWLVGGVVYVNYDWPEQFTLDPVAQSPIKLILDCRKLWLEFND